MRELRSFSDLHGSSLSSRPVFVARFGLNLETFECLKNLSWAEEQLTAALGPLKCFPVDAAPYDPRPPGWYSDEGD
jgi:hypothetical protein